VDEYRYGEPTNRLDIGHSRGALGARTAAPTGLAKSGRRNASSLFLEQLESSSLRGGRVLKDHLPGIMSDTSTTATTTPSLYRHCRCDEK